MDSRCPYQLLKELLSRFRDELHLLNTITIHPTHDGQVKGLTRGYTLEQTKPNFTQLGNHVSNIDTTNVIFASYMDIFSGIVPNTPANIARKLVDTNLINAPRTLDITTVPIALRHINKSLLLTQLEPKECEKPNGDLSSNSHSTSRNSLTRQRNSSSHQRGPNKITKQSTKRTRSTTRSTI